jgi:hypothetical protein
MDASKFVLYPYCDTICIGLEEDPKLSNLNIKEVGEK